MGTNQQTRRWIAWVACFAILLASLAPSISHAVAAARLINPSPQSDICSTIKLTAATADEGLKADYARTQKSDSNAITVDVGGQHSSHAPTLDMHFEHCPFCFTHAGSFGLPASATLSPLATVPFVARMPLRFYESAAPIFAWEAAQPRAPPIFS